MGCLGAPGPARAQSEPEKRQRAKDHYEMANRFYDVGKYGDAINEYEQAYLLIEDPALLFNIGQAYRLWDRPEDALRSYRNYLRRRPDASNRADVEKKIADLERTLDDRRRAGASPPQPALSPPPALSPAAVSPPPGPPPVNVGSTAGEPPTVSAPTVVPTPVQPSVDVSAMARPTNAPSQPKRWIAYSLLGVGGAGIVTSIISAAVGASKAQKLKTASQNREPFDPAVEANGQTANRVAVVSGLIGVVAGGTGGYLLWRWRGTSSHSVSIAPALTPAYAGASALLTF
jgi:tetratricopeptide (TPR) repeat protein